MSASLMVAVFGCFAVDFSESLRIDEHLTSSNGSIPIGSGASSPKSATPSLIVSCSGSVPSAKVTRTVRPHLAGASELEVVDTSILKDGDMVLLDRKEKRKVAKRGTKFILDRPTEHSLKNGSDVFICGGPAVYGSLATAALSTSVQASTPAALALAERGSKVGENSVERSVDGRTRVTALTEHSKKVDKKADAKDEGQKKAKVQSRRTASEETHADKHNDRTDRMLGDSKGRAEKKKVNSELRLDVSQGKKRGAATRDKHLAEKEETDYYEARDTSMIQGELTSTERTNSKFVDEANKIGLEDKLALEESVVKDERRDRPAVEKLKTRATVHEDVPTNFGTRSVANRNSLCEGHAEVRSEATVGLGASALSTSSMTSMSQASLESREQPSSDPNRGVSRELIDSQIKAQNELRERELEVNEKKKQIAEKQKDIEKELDVLAELETKLEVAKEHLEDLDAQVGAQASQSVGWSPENRKGKVDEQVEKLEKQLEKSITFSDSSKSVEKAEGPSTSAQQPGDWETRKQDMDEELQDLEKKLKTSETFIQSSGSVEKAEQKTEGEGGSKIDSGIVLVKKNSKAFVDVTSASGSTTKEAKSADKSVDQKSKQDISEIDSIDRDKGFVQTQSELPNDVHKKERPIVNNTRELSNAKRSTTENQTEHEGKTAKLTPSVAKSKTSHDPARTVPTKPSLLRAAPKPKRDLDGNQDEYESAREDDQKPESPERPDLEDTIKHTLANDSVVALSSMATDDDEKDAAEQEATDYGVSSQAEMTKRMRTSDVDKEPLTEMTDESAEDRDERANTEKMSETDDGYDGDDSSATLAREGNSEAEMETSQAGSDKVVLDTGDEVLNGEEPDVQPTDERHEDASAQSSDDADEDDGVAGRASTT
eukprot:TRINITY_DN51893_c0_g1_i1.p1 TRINITY_DN51893_c0_g1~~TRINITY_DN51893_c0_g1_i1.p1  ORF type:complete len:931 (-),score=173.25 TRINITY_DN51893_c0_g1_i1:51-2714(-)